MTVAADDVFGDAPLSARMQELAGENVGIRDLASVDGGLLVLAGPSRNEPVPYVVFRWDESGALKRLMQLEMSGLPANAKAETLLILEELPQFYRALVMFDGIENGGPREIRIEK
jgi:hypothetical protein